MMRKMGKGIVIFVIVATLSIFLVACGSTGGGSQDDGRQPGYTQPQPTSSGFKDESLIPYPGIGLHKKEVRFTTLEDGNVFRPSYGGWFCIPDGYGGELPPLDKDIIVFTYDYHYEGTQDKKPYYAWVYGWEPIG
jgi:hypothetical protein